MYGVWLNWGHLSVIRRSRKTAHERWEEDMKRTYPTRQNQLVKSQHFHCSFLFPVQVLHLDIPNRLTLHRRLCPLEPLHKRPQQHSRLAGAFEIGLREPLHVIAHIFASKVPALFIHLGRARHVEGRELVFSMNTVRRSDNQTNAPCRTPKMEEKL